MIEERHEEAAALYALDLLQGEERAAFEAELARNPELRTLTQQLRETGAALAHVAPAGEPSPFLRERVLASARARTSHARRAARWPAMMGWGAAACFAFGAAVLGWELATTRRELTEQSQAMARADSRSYLQREAVRRETADRLQLMQGELEKMRAALNDERVQSGQIIAALRQQASVAELKIQSLASLVENTPQARAIAVWNPLTQEGVLTVVNLPALEANKDYQLWFLEPQNEVPVDAGVFRVDGRTGEARLTFKPTRPVRAVDKFAVSLERRGGVPKPEGPVVLLTK